MLSRIARRMAGLGRIASKFQDISNQVLPTLEAMPNDDLFDFIVQNVQDGGYSLFDRDSDVFEALTAGLEWEGPCYVINWQPSYENRNMWLLDEASKNSLLKAVEGL